MLCVVYYSRVTPAASAPASAQLPIRRDTAASSFAGLSPQQDSLEGVPQLRYMGSTPRLDVPKCADGVLHEAAVLAKALLPGPIRSPAGRKERDHNLSSQQSLVCTELVAVGWWIDCLPLGHAAASTS